jgi:hypothetical protein
MYETLSNMPLVWRVDKKIGKDYYNTKSSWLDHQKGKKRIQKSQETSNIQLDEDNNPWDNQDQHVLEMGKIYDRELIEIIRTKFERALNESEEIYDRGFGGKYQQQLNSVTKEESSQNVPAFDFKNKIPELKKIVNDELINTLNHYWKSHFRVDRVSLYRNFHVPDDVRKEEEILSDRWHMDSGDPSRIKLFLMLNDVTEDHGPFHVISRENSKEIYRGGYNRNKEGFSDSLVKDSANVIKATGPAGTAMLANTHMCLHRAGVPKKGNIRDVVSIRFEPATEPISDAWLSTRS